MRRQAGRQTDRQAGRQAGAQHPNAKIQISFYGPYIYIHTYRNNDHKVFYDPVPTHDLSGMLEQPTRKIPVFYKERKKGMKI